MTTIVHPLIPRLVPARLAPATKGATAATCLTYGDLEPPEH